MGRLAILIADDRGWLDQNDFFRHDFVLAAIAADFGEMVRNVVWDGISISYGVHHHLKQDGYAGLSEMSSFEFLEEVVGINAVGEHCHPYKHTVNGEPDKFSYSFESHNKNFKAATAKQLIELIEEGAFNGQGKIRMLPPDSKNTKKNGAMSVALYKGQPLPKTKKTKHVAKASSSTRRYWWVNHKKTFKSEIEGGYIWSPKKKKDGAFHQTYENLTFVQPGDVIVSYAHTFIKAIGVAISGYREAPKPGSFGRAGENWPDAGWLVSVEWTLLHIPISPKASMDQIRPYLPTKYSPLRENGNGNESCYLARISSDLGSLIVGLTKLANAPSIKVIEDLEQQTEENLEQEKIENADIPETEKEMLVRSRRGQGVFRQKTLAIESCCRLTKVKDENFLIASHIKPWKNSSNQERLDGNNGLMLAPHVDKLFDRGWISFMDDGELLVVESAKAVLLAWGLNPNANVGSFNAEQRVYLKHHRAAVFKENQSRRK
jgi:hypothetical protein